jgi:phosphoribosylformimino-5-aminoimidazole carboxamide ribotide isomerase
VLAHQFEIVPAVDVLDGRVVRLSEGRREAITMEGGRAEDLASRFAAEGATRVHLVDLGGAFSGVPDLALVRTVARACGIPVQVGGGYRTLDAVSAALDAGADRVMVGTAAMEPGFLAAAVARVGERLVVAVDGRAGRVAVDGWTRRTTTTAAELARRCAAERVRRLLVTGTSRDGSLAGPDIALLQDVLPAGLPVLAAGGIGSIEDLRVVRDLGCEGAVCGSALLAGRFTLADARAALDPPPPARSEPQHRTGPPGAGIREPAGRVNRHDPGTQASHDPR